MSGSDPTDLLADLAALGLAPGCDLAMLKDRYRRAMQQAHPDRQRAPNAAASERAARLTASYRRLLDFHRARGRLPGQRLASAAPGARGDDAVVVPQPRARTGRHAPVLLGLLALGALIVAPRFDSGFPRDAGANDAHATDAAALIDTGDKPHARGLRAGDSKARVRALLGAPILQSDTVWEYGPSHVNFDHGRVVSWYSSPLKPLRVDEAGEPR